MESRYRASNRAFEVAAGASRPAHNTQAAEPSRDSKTLRERVWVRIERRVGVRHTRRERSREQPTVQVQGQFQFQGQGQGQGQEQGQEQGQGQGTMCGS